MTERARLLHTKAVTVQTVAVEVKALKIGPKQVTQAVFRQLPKEPLIDQMTGELRGVPWGNVNYFWGDCTPNHLHTVWQHGQRLFRDCVYDPDTTIPAGVQQYVRVWDRAEHRLRDLALGLVALHSWEDPAYLTKWYQSPQPGIALVFAFAPDVTIRVELPAGWPQPKTHLATVIWDYFHRIIIHQQSWNLASQKAALWKAMQEYFPEEPWHDDPTETAITTAVDAQLAIWHTAKHAAAPVQQAFRGQYTTLQVLDQLFIAV